MTFALGMSCQTIGQPAHVPMLVTNENDAIESLLLPAHSCRQVKELLSKEDAAKQEKLRLQAAAYAAKRDLGLMAEPSTFFKLWQSLDAADGLR